MGVVGVPTLLDADACTQSPQHCSQLLVSCSSYCIAQGGNYRHNTIVGLIIRESVHMSCLRGMNAGHCAGSIVLRAGGGRTDAAATAAEAAALVAPGQSPLWVAPCTVVLAMMRPLPQAQVIASARRNDRTAMAPFNVQHTECPPLLGSSSTCKHPCMTLCSQTSGHAMRCGNV